MIADTILLKKTPKIEFRLLDQGFQLIDEQTERNSGFYSYQDLQFIELNKPWFPKLAKWLRKTSGYYINFTLKSIERKLFHIPL